MTARFAGTVLALVCGMSASPLAAQSQPDVTDAMLECREITRDTDRLKCFDRVLDANFEPDPKIEEQREAAFGITSEDSRAEAEELSATITEVEVDQKFGTILFALDNGQVWQASASGSLRRFRIGDQATIAEDRFGGFRVRLEGRRGFRGVKRVR